VCYGDEDAKMRRCEDAKMRRCEDAKMRRCEDGKIEIEEGKRGGVSNSIHSKYNIQNSKLFHYHCRVIFKS
jgi:hypothetical protein